MQHFVGLKRILGKQMTRAEYCAYQGWELPEDENGEDDGYLVEYLDGGKGNHADHVGYISWSPLEVFGLSYRPVDAMPFGFAIEALKGGFKLARKGWNGKGMFVVYQKGYPEGIPCNKQTADAWGLNENDNFVVNPYLQLKCVDGSHSMWVPSINDVLAEDWVLVSP